MWLILLLAISAHAQAPSLQEKVISIDSWRECGLITRFSPLLIPPNCLQSVNNVEFDADGSMSRRKGYAQYNLTACTGAQSIRGLWPFYSTDGTKYLVAYSSGSMFYTSGDGTCNAITGLGGLSLTAEMSCVQAMGYLWCTNGVDSMFRTNVASTQTITAAPLGKLIATYRNRIITAGVGGNYTRLYLSGELDGTDWALNLFPSLSTSPVVIDVSGTNDGDKINCLMGQYQNQFLIGRNYDTYALSGYSNQDFALRKISAEVGCIESKSVQEVNNVLYWMSKRGVEGYTGVMITPVSYPIEPTINQIITAAGDSRIQTLTTQSDWQSGNLLASGLGAPMSATISAGNVVPTTWTVIEESTAVFVLGTLVNVTTIAANGGMVLWQGSTSAFINAGGESGDATNWVDTSYIATLDGSMFGSYIWKNIGTGVGNVTCPSMLRVDIRVPETFAMLKSTTTYLASGTSGNFRFDTSTLTHSTVVLYIITSVGGAYSVPMIRGVDISIKYKDVGTGGKCATAWDIDESHITTSGTYTTTRYDTGFSTPVWGAFSATISSSSVSPILFQTRVGSTSVVALDSPVGASMGGVISSTPKRFIVSVSSFSVDNSTETPPFLSSLSMSAATTGYYIAPCIQVSTPTSWGLFQADGVTMGGSLTFYLSTGATCAISTATNANWTLQGVNAQIVVTTATPYIAARVLFNMNVATNSPTLNDITFNWNTGSSRPPVSSASYKDRYYLFYTTSTAGSPVNDHAGIYDYNQKWTLFDDIHAYSATLYLNQLYYGDSNSTGLIYLQDSGQSDNGSSFDMSFKTADLDGGTPQEPKSFSRVYLTLSAPNSNPANTNILCNYSLNGSSQTYSLGSVTLSESTEQTGYFIAKFPFKTGQAAIGNWINLGCSYNGANGPVSVYGLKLIYKPLAWE